MMVSISVESKTWIVTQDRARVKLVAIVSQEAILDDTMKFRCNPANSRGGSQKETTK